MNNKRCIRYQYSQVEDGYQVEIIEQTAIQKNFNPSFICTDRWSYSKTIDGLERTLTSSSSPVPCGDRLFYVRGENKKFDQNVMDMDTEQFRIFEMLVASYNKDFSDLKWPGEWAIRVKRPDTKLEAMQLEAMQKEIDELSKKLADSHKEFTDVIKDFKEQVKEVVEKIAVDIATLEHGIRTHEHDQVEMPKADNEVSAVCCSECGSPAYVEENWGEWCVYCKEAPGEGTGDYATKNEAIAVWNKMNGG